MRCFAWLFGTIAVSIILAGCGGGGSTSAGSGLVGLFITDGFDNQYQQVLVTLYRVEVGQQGRPSSFRIVYSEPAGITVDIRALAGLTLFIGVGTLPEGVYNQARITLGNQITLVNLTGQSSTVPIDNGVGTPVGTNQIQLQFPIQLRVMATGSNTLIIDFDLPSFQLINGMVHPALRHLHEQEVGSRRKYAEVEGVITARQEQQLTLQLRNGRFVKVLLTPQTSIYAESGQNATLAVGQKVEVEGTPDLMSMQIIAERIKIEGLSDDSEPHELPEIKGVIRSVGDGRFTVAVTRIRHGMPPLAEVTVRYTEQTHWHHDESPASPADLQPGKKVEVEGTYDASTQILNALVIELDD